MEHIFQSFPNLKKDQGFKITSKPDYKYNCIAWAAIVDNEWIWPTGYRLDGVTCYWPDKVDRNDSIETFIKVFELFGYEICENYSYEKLYRKIALYINPITQRCTHASRQLLSGFWTSKLGKEEDIQHSSPYEIESSIYGKVAIIMRKSRI